MQLKDRINKILQKEYPKKRRWEAFIYWWLSAIGYEYEANPSHINFVDGHHDGGIDVIAWPLESHTKNEVLIVQSKYFGTSPTANDLSRFRQAVDAINGSLEEFQNWLDHCRVELHPLYRRLRETRRRHRYILILPSRLDSGLKRSLKRGGIEVHDTYVLTNLERNFIEGRTPRLEEIRLSGASTPRKIADASGTHVLVFTVPAKELGVAYERYGDVLFAGNIRYALRGQTARRVRQGIDDTLQQAPHEFVFSHNGITISGEGLRRRGTNVVLQSATIVNGAQTVSYLGRPRVMKYLHRNPARVMVKFVQVDNPEVLNDIESKVAYRSNNQNKVEPSDLMIELASLVSLQRHFRRQGVHLERKKGEQKLHMGELRIAKERLAQVLAAIESPQGAVKGKRKQELFEDSAARLFGDYDISDRSRAEAVAWARVDDILHWTIRQFENKKRKKRAQLAQFAALTVFHRSIRSCGLKNGFLRSLSRWETTAPTIEQFLQKSFKAILSSLLQRSSQQKKNEPAFYKALESVKPAVNYATRHSRRRIRRYYRQYLS